MNQEEYDSAVAAMELMLKGKPWVKTYAGGKPHYTYPQFVKMVDGLPCMTVTEHEHIVREMSANIRQEWVGLTDEDVGALQDFAYADDVEFIRHIEAKLKLKNTK